MSECADHQNLGSLEWLDYIERAVHHNLGSLEWLGYISVTEISCHLDLPKWQVCSKAAEFLVLLSVACRKLQTHLLHSQQSLFVTTL